MMFEQDEPDDNNFETFLTKYSDGGYNVEDRQIQVTYEPRSYPIRFPRQPNITKTCRAIRSETLPIFYGANEFYINDWYNPRRDGVQTPFPKLLVNWLIAIESHIPLFNLLQISSHGPTQQRYELMARLMDYGFPFKEGALQDGWYEP